jgi:hypothetical protein
MIMKYDFKMTPGMGAPLTIKCEFSGPGLVGFAESGRPPGPTIRLMPTEKNGPREYGSPLYFAAGVVEMLEAAYEAGRRSVGQDIRALLNLGKV